MLEASFMAFRMLWRRWWAEVSGTSRLLWGLPWATYHLLSFPRGGTSGGGGTLHQLRALEQQPALSTASASVVSANHRMGKSCLPNLNLPGG